MQETVQKLITNFHDDKDGGKSYPVQMKINPNVTFANLKDNPTAIWTLLAFTGYLSLGKELTTEGYMQIYEARIPNREILGVYKKSVKAWFTDKLEIPLNHLGEFDVENLIDLEEYVRDVLSKNNNITGDANIRLVHTVIDGLYLVKGKRSHTLSSEKNSVNGRFYSTYYPVACQSEKVIIHEYKFLRLTETDDIDKQVQEALWQFYENYYFQGAVQKFKEHNYSHYKVVEIRALVVFIDGSTNKLGIRSAAISHSITEMEEILPLFEKFSKDNLAELKRAFTILDVIKSYRNTEGFVSFDVLLEDLKVKSHGSINVKEFGRELGNYSLAKHLCDTYGDHLFKMSEKELRAVKKVGKIRALAISKYLRNSNKRESTTASSVEDEKI
jgi:hypothetical protein